MKKPITALLCVFAMNTAAYATDEQSKITEPKINHNDDAAAEEFFNPTEYNETFYPTKKDRGSSFFVGLETSLMSYAKTKITDDKSDFSSKINTFSLNQDIFNNLSLLFGVDMGNTGRVTFNINQSSIETETEDTDMAAYSLRVDMPIIKDKIITPFLRLGVGYISINEGGEDISSPMLILGFGGNYNISQHVFSYLAMNVAFMPEADIGKTDLNYKETLFTVSVGLGYKF